MDQRNHGRTVGSYGYTADAMAGGNVEFAVWGQVYEGYLIHTFEAPVLFKQPETLPLETDQVFGSGTNR